MKIKMSLNITELIGSVLLSALMLLPAKLLGAADFDGSVKASLVHLLQNNRDYKKSLADWKTARQNVRSASSAAFPSISFDWNYTRLGNIQTFMMEDGDSTDSNPPEILKVASENTYKGALSIEQQLFSGSVFKAILVARSYQKAADAQILVDKNRLIRDYLTAYARADMLDDMVAVNQDMLDYTMLHFKEAELLHEMGAVDNYSLLRAEVEHLNSVPAFREATRSYHDAISHLKLMLHLDKDANLHIFSFDVELNLAGNQSELHGRAKANRPELVRAKNVSEAYKHVVSVYRAGRLPSISGFGTYDRQNQWDLFGQQNTWNNSWAAGINIHIPVFSGLSTSAQVQISKLDYIKASEDESILGDAIRNEVQMAYDDYIRSSADFDAWFRNVDLASEGFKIAQLRWSNGDGSELELRDARIALQRAQANLSRAKYDKLRTKIEMLFSLGEIDNVVIIEAQNNGE